MLLLAVAAFVLLDQADFEITQLLTRKQLQQDYLAETDYYIAPMELLPAIDLITNKDSCLLDSLALDDLFA